MCVPEADARDGPDGARRSCTRTEGRQGLRLSTLKRLPAPKRHQGPDRPAWGRGQEPPGPAPLGGGAHHLLGTALHVSGFATTAPEPRCSRCCCSPSRLSTSAGCAKQMGYETRCKPPATGHNAQRRAASRPSSSSLGCRRATVLARTKSPYRSLGGECARRAGRPGLGRFPRRPGRQLVETFTFAKGNRFGSLTPTDAGFSCGL